MFEICWQLVTVWNTIVDTITCMTIPNKPANEKPIKAWGITKITEIIGKTVMLSRNSLDYVTTKNSNVTAETVVITTE